MPRLALGVEYHGGAFHGWQRQPHCVTVQGALEQALSAVAGEAIAVVAAGRTDRGVHARGQVVHFDTAVIRPMQAWVRGGNAHLPATVAVLWAQGVSDEFHARFDARSRTYRYRLLSHPVRPAYAHGVVGWTHRVLDLDAMKAGARLLLGTHDFSAFRAAECQARTPVKTLLRLDINSVGEEIHFEFQADAFLQHMVRNLVGALLRVGCGEERSDWLAALLEARDRTQSAPTFAADGLCLTAVEYDERWNFPAGRS
ncbi:MAG: tRNA pseudouridine(38-40) synthase TruA [Ferrovum sp.]|nr:tRNA pseudouridine(38-40) synthase TruA [Ferrovum sp.]NDU87119.1 tRNA pseudouridine(38-40) synthase TruA [Ferrovum sp.]